MYTKYCKYFIKIIFLIFLPYSGHASIFLNNQTEVIADQFNDLWAKTRYNIEEGDFRFLSPYFCEEIVKLKGRINCYGQNPISPYAMPMFKADDTIVPPKESSILSQPSEDGLQGVWHLGQSEAIVLIGLAPPEFRYFSFTPYIMSRYKFLNNIPGIKDIMNIVPFIGQSITKSHRDLFNPLNVAMNNKSILSMNHYSHDRRSCGLEYFIYIMAGDEFILESAVDSLEAILRENKISQEIINTSRLPTYGLRLGYHKRDDTFMILMRSALLETKQTYDCGDSGTVSADSLWVSYMDNPPIRAFRISDINQKNSKKTRVVKFPPMEQGWKVDLKTEIDHLDSYMNSFFESHGYLTQHYGPFARSSTVSANSSLGLNTIYKSTLLGYSTLGASPDARYTSNGFFNLDDDELAMYIGVNHAYVPAPDNAYSFKSTYSSLTIYQLKSIGALLSFSDEELLGSAVINGLSGDLGVYEKQLFIAFVANDCSQHQLPPNAVCKSLLIDYIQDLGYKSGDPIISTERIYLRGDSEGIVRNSREELQTYSQRIYRKR